MIHSIKNILLFVLIAINWTCENSDKEDFTYKVLSPALSEVFHTGDTINIEVEVSHNVKSAEFYFDNERIGTSNSGSVELSWASMGQSGGNHTITIRVYPMDYEPVFIYVPLVFEYHQGEQNQGGIIFCLDETRIHGMVVATGDVFYKDKIEFIWGPETYVGATDTADGSSNTDILSNSAILASYVWPAFKFGYIYGGYDDWYVASKTEMLKLYEFISAGNTDLQINDTYWTSTECCRANACAVDFNLGKAITCLKADSLFRIRPIRKF